MCRDLAVNAEGAGPVLDHAPLTCVAALRLGAQSQDGSDEGVREILETVDLVRLAAVADELGMRGWRR